MLVFFFYSGPLQAQGSGDSTATSFREEQERLLFDIELKSILDAWNVALQQPVPENLETPILQFLGKQFTAEQKSNFLDMGRSPWLPIEYKLAVIVKKAQLQTDPKDATIEIDEAKMPYKPEEFEALIWWQDISTFFSDADRKNLHDNSDQRKGILTLPQYQYYVNTDPSKQRVHLELAWHYEEKSSLTSKQLLEYDEAGKPVEKQFENQEKATIDRVHASTAVVPLGISVDGIQIDRNTGYPNVNSASMTLRHQLSVDHRILRSALESFGIPEYLQLTCSPDVSLDLRKVDITFNGASFSFSPQGPSLEVKPNMKLTIDAHRLQVAEKTTEGQIYFYEPDNDEAGYDTGEIPRFFDLLNSSGQTYQQQILEKLKEGFNSHIKTKPPQYRDRDGVTRDDVTIEEIKAFSSLSPVFGVKVKVDDLFVQATLAQQPSAPNNVEWHLGLSPESNESVNLDNPLVSHMRKKVETEVLKHVGELDTLNNASFFNYEKLEDLVKFEVSSVDLNTRTIDGVLLFQPSDTVMDSVPFESLEKFLEGFRTEFPYDWNANGAKAMDQMNESGGIVPRIHDIAEEWAKSENVLKTQDVAKEIANRLTAKGFLKRFNDSSVVQQVKFFSVYNEDTDKKIAFSFSVTVGHNTIIREIGGVIHDLDLTANRLGSYEFDFSKAIISGDLLTRLYDQIIDSSPSLSLENLTFDKNGLRMDLIYKNEQLLLQTPLSVATILYPWKEYEKRHAV